MYNDYVTDSIHSQTMLRLLSMTPSPSNGKKIPMKSNVWTYKFYIYRSIFSVRIKDLLCAALQVWRDDRALWDCGLKFWWLVVIIYLSKHCCYNIEIPLKIELPLVPLDIEMPLNTKPPMNIKPSLITTLDGAFINEYALKHFVLN